MAHGVRRGVTVRDRILTTLRNASSGHKVLVFSQFQDMLDILQDYCALAGWNYERLDGSVRSEERWLSMQRFNAGGAASDAGEQDDTPFVFLLSTRAGGVGLNLAAADTVVLFDSDWNPMIDLQVRRH